MVDSLTKAWDQFVLNGSGNRVIHGLIDLRLDITFLFA